MLEKVREIRKLQESGVPYFIRLNVPKLNKFYTGITKAEIFIITAATGGGKTSFAKYLFVIKAIESAIKYGIDYKCLYFALEETQEQFKASLYSYFIFEQTGLEYNIKDFNGMSVDNDNNIIFINDLLLESMEKVNAKVEQYMSYIELQTQTLSPGNIYKKIKTLAKEDGVKFFKLVNGTEIEMSIKEAETEKYDRKEIGEFKFRTVVIDHVGNIASKDKFNSIAELAFYCRGYVVSLFEYNVVYVQQQTKDKGTVENKKNDNIWASIEGLANYKALSDDAHTIIGLTNPNTYGVRVIGSSDPVKVSDFQDNLRIVEILKNRYGAVNKKIIFGFNGKVNYFESFPDDPMQLEITKSKFLTN